MTALGPPKLAPEGVPRPVAHYLDNAAAYLRDLAKRTDLEFRPYDQHRPEQPFWLHGLYGACRDRQFCIQVVTDIDLSIVFGAMLNCYVRHYPTDGSHLWLLLEQRRVTGMAALLKDAALLATRARLACAWRMPHPTDPDPKA